MFPIYSAALPCGHVASKIFWYIMAFLFTCDCLTSSDSYQMEDVASIKCSEQVRKGLPGCEHLAVMACHRDPSTVSCMERCEGTLPCCLKMCKASCSGCRSLALQRTQLLGGRVSRTYHTSHSCGLLLPCQHACGLDCVKGHTCNTKCLQRCRQRCAHQECSKPCSEPCAPCMKPCEWSCAHFICPMPCGSVRATYHRVTHRTEIDRLSYRSALGFLAMSCVRSLYNAAILVPPVRYKQLL